MVISDVDPRTLGAHRCVFGVDRRLRAGHFFISSYPPNISYISHWKIETSVIHFLGVLKIKFGAEYEIIQYDKLKLF